MNEDVLVTFATKNVDPTMFSIKKPFVNQTFNALSLQPTENYRDFSRFATGETMTELLDTFAVTNQCKGAVNFRYLNRAIAGSNMIGLIWRHDDIQEKISWPFRPVGFLVANTNFEDDTSDVTLDVICAEPGYGKYLLACFITWISQSKKSITIDSLAHVIIFYKNFGFNFYRDNDCSKPLRIPRGIVKTLAQKGIRYSSFEDVIVDKEYKQLLDYIVKNGAPTSCKYGACDGLYTMKLCRNNL